MSRSQEPPCPEPPRHSNEKGTQNKQTATVRLASGPHSSRLLHTGVLTRVIPRLLGDGEGGVVDSHPAEAEGEDDDRQCLLGDDHLHPGRRLLVLRIGCVGYGSDMLSCYSFKAIAARQTTVQRLH